MIAAAGLGSRLGHGVPKCLIEVDGRPIISHLVDALAPYVNRVHLVIGYREDLVTDYCAMHHRDLVLVRNPDFRANTTLTSYHLGARGLHGKVLFVDGDSILRRSSLARFVSAAVEHEITLGVTEASTDDAVFVTTTGSERDGLFVDGFTREDPQSMEWANLLVCPPHRLRPGTGFVYESLEPLLPIRAARIELCEVDTEADLSRAQQQVASWNSSR